MRGFNAMYQIGEVWAFVLELEFYSIGGEAGYDDRAGHVDDGRLGRRIRDGIVQRASDGVSRSAERILIASELLEIPCSVTSCRT